MEHISYATCSWQSKMDHRVLMIRPAPWLKQVIPTRPGAKFSLTWFPNDGKGRVPAAG